MPVRDAYVFESGYPLGLPGKSFQGDSYFLGDNLRSAALITYYLRDKLVSENDKRIKEEEKAAKENQDVHYPSYEQLVKEREEEKAKYYVVIETASGDVVRKLPVSGDRNGVARITWDLRTPSKGPIRLGGSSGYNPFSSPEEGPLVPPGAYNVFLERWKDGEMTTISEKTSLMLKTLDNKVLPSQDVNAMVDFKRKIENLDRIQQSASGAIRAAFTELNHIRKAITQMEEREDVWLKSVMLIENKLKGIQRKLSGDPLKAQLDMDTAPSVSDRISRIMYENKYSSSAPTGTHKRSFETASNELAAILPELKDVLEKELAALRTKLWNAGAPYTPNVIPAWEKN